ncbi:SRPBCC domain-containing protein [Paenibacillus sp. 1011MAR3C5]|uniref:SRPBCC family protein n=1 Tax=Paenibacillus sp. 1011MAR3C5 TaxID=1675787 RepID=UPI00160214AF|nr:SRPBCC domain-containing protein [Paenibacillus sp. 1011MAR3C5]
MISLDDGKFLLKLHHVYNASIDRVFQAWTKKEQLEQWWGLTDFTTTVEQMDVTVGGSYIFHMEAPNGSIHTLAGHYVEIVPNKKLSFTWKWVNEGASAEETLVTIGFVEKGGKTELIITHSKFSTMQAAKRHNNNWTHALEGGLCSYLH